MLTNDQIRNLALNCEYLLEMYQVNKETFLSQYSKMDEIWVHKKESAWLIICKMKKVLKASIL